MHENPEAAKKIGASVRNLESKSLNIHGQDLRRKSEDKRYLTNADEIASYTFRRIGPTWAHIVGLSDAKVLALGNWQDKPGKGKAMTPLRYSAVKLALASRLKLVMASSLVPFLQSASWDEIAPSKALEAMNNAETIVDEMLENDTITFAAKKEDLPELVLQFCRQESSLV